MSNKRGIALLSNCSRPKTKEGFFSKHAYDYDEYIYNSLPHFFREY